MDFIQNALRTVRLTDMTLIESGDFVDIGEEVKGELIEPDLQQIVKLKWAPYAPKLVLENGKTVSAKDVRVYPVGGIIQIAKAVRDAHEYAEKSLYKHIPDE